jgi:hypothetical protein
MQVSSSTSVMAGVDPTASVSQVLGKYADGGTSGMNHTTHDNDTMNTWTSKTPLLYPESR